MHCQDVSSFNSAPVKMCRLWAGALCVCAHVCVHSFYFCPKCIVKMCRLSAMHLSRCVVFGQGPCVCVLSFYFCPKCIVKMSSFGNAPVKMCRLLAGGLVHVCVCFCVIPRRQYSTFKVTGGSTAVMTLSTENGTGQLC